MEAPQCKICGEKHYGLCPTRQVATTTLAAVVKATKPKKDHRLITAAKEAAAMAKAGTVADQPMPRSREEILAGAMERTAFETFLYMPDGSINEEAARAGHNAFTKLAMRKYRARKKANP